MWVADKVLERLVEGGQAAFDGKVPESITYRNSNTTLFSK